MEPRSVTGCARAEAVRERWRSLARKTWPTGDIVSSRTVKIDCEGAASPSVILGTPSENDDLRRGHIGSWRVAEDERIEDIGPVLLAR